MFQLEQVKQWMLHFQQEVRTKIAIPPNKEIKLRLTTLDEEVHEMFKASEDFEKGLITKEQFLQALLDGLGDELVFIFGTVHSFGLPIVPAFDAIMASNWTKEWKKGEIESAYAQGWEVFPCRICCTPSYECKCDNEQRCFVVHNQAGKVMKSPSYTPVDLSPIVDAALQR